MNYAEREDIFRSWNWKCVECSRERSLDPSFRPRAATDLHHALIPRDKRYPELDVEENLAPLCHLHHVGLQCCDKYEWREWFWGVQCERYGKDHMELWMEEVSLNIKPKYKTEAPA